jgi:hypothetical protein
VSMNTTPISATAAATPNHAMANLRYGAEVACSALRL